MSQSSNPSSDSYYYLPYTLPIHLPGLVSTNPADSPHMPLPQKAVPPEVPGYTDILPERVGCDFGMDMSFKYIPNDYEVLKDCILCVRLAPLTAGAGGSAARYPADVLNHAIEYIQFQIGGATIQQITGDEIHFKQLVELPPEEFQRIEAAQHYADDETARAALADHTNYPNGVWYFLEIPFWWTETAAKHWHQYACQRQTRINIKWRNAEYILQQNTANTKPTPYSGFSTYIVEAFLRFRISALDTAVKDTFTNSVKSLGSNGLNYLMQFSQRQENCIIPEMASGQYTIQLTNFNKPTYMMRFVVRRAGDLEANYTGNERFLHQMVSYYQADASGHRLWPKMSSEFAKIEVNGKEFLNDFQNNVYHVLHTDYADVNQYPMGCIEYGKLQNPTLTLYWDSWPTLAVGDDLVCDVWAYCYDYLRMVITQDNRSAVNLEQPI